MAKTCDICGSKLGMFDSKSPTFDGYLCGKCVGSTVEEMHLGSSIILEILSKKYFSQILRSPLITLLLLIQKQKKMASCISNTIRTLKIYAQN